MSESQELLIGLVSISDRASAGVYEDKGIPGLKQWFAAALSTPWRMETRLIPDEQALIERTLIELVDTVGCHLVLTTGGTGPAPRDVTPEAVKPLFRREIDGFSVLFHQASFGTVGLSTLQSRACAGQIGDTFIFCLPGSTGACRDGWDLVLRDELDSRYRPCSLAGLVPRLKELVQS